MGIVNWREVAQDRDGWRRATRKSLSGATEEDEEEEAMSL
jgi:hypothetical protein